MTSSRRCPECTRRSVVVKLRPAPATSRAPRDPARRAPPPPFPVDQIGVRMAAVHPGEDAGRRPPAGDHRADVQIVPLMPADGLVHGQERASIPWPLRRDARSAPRAAAPNPAAVGPLPAASPIASHEPSRFSTKSNQSPPTSYVGSNPPASWAPVIRRCAGGAGSAGSRRPAWAACVVAPPRSRRCSRSPDRAPPHPAWRRPPARRRECRRRGTAP